MLRSLVRYCSCHSNKKFINSRHRVISLIFRPVEQKSPKRWPFILFIIFFMEKGRTSWNENRTAQHIRNIVQVQSKHKEREIRKRSRSIFTRWPTMIELLPIHTCGKRTQMHSREWKFVYSLRWRLRLHFHLRWGGSQWLESTRDIWIWCVQAASVCFTKKDFVPSVFAFFQIITVDG